MTTNPLPLTVHTAHERDRPVLEQLWTMFRHDLSAVTGTLPDEDGRFRQERLDAGLSEPGWSAHLLRLDTRPVGLAVLRGLDADEHVISSFFVVGGARRAGLGRTAVLRITSDHPGRWAVAFQDANTIAARFWRSVAAAVDQEHTLERLAVPGRPDLPPDTWVRFRVR